MTVKQNLPLFSSPLLSLASECERDTYERRSLSTQLFQMMTVGEGEPH